ncbi:MAG: cupin domain-containing protein, partial [Bryobacteraceae bacterium]
ISSGGEILRCCPSRLVRKLIWTRVAVDGADHSVSGGTVVYVPAGVPHQFHSVVEDLRVLVFFAPAEGTVQRSD